MCRVTLGSKSFFAKKVFRVFPLSRRISLNFSKLEMLFFLMSHEIKTKKPSVTSVSPVSSKLGLSPASYNQNNSGDLVPRDQP